MKPLFDAGSYASTAQPCKRQAILSKSGQCTGNGVSLAFGPVSRAVLGESFCYEGDQKIILKDLLREVEVRSSAYNKHLA